MLEQRVRPQLVRVFFQRLFQNFVINSRENRDGEMQRAIYELQLLDIRKKEQNNREDSSQVRLFYRIC